MSAARVDDDGRKWRTTPGPWIDELDGGDYLVQARTTPLRRMEDGRVFGVELRLLTRDPAHTVMVPRARASAITLSEAWRGLLMAAVGFVRDKALLEEWRVLPDTGDGIMDALPLAPVVEREECGVAHIGHPCPRDAKRRVGDDAQMTAMERAAESRGEP